MAGKFTKLSVVMLAILHSSYAALLGDENRPSLREWPFFQDVPLPQAAEEGADKSKYCDFILTPAVFDHALIDLADLRLRDPATGAEIPYALRLRENNSGTEVLTAREFNRVPGPDQSSELSLDLGENPPEHNQVEIETPGVNFRRRALLEGSDDGREWRKINEKELIYFVRGDDKLKDWKLDYTPSRFRYLRLRVDRDPEVDKDKKPVEIGEVTIRRAVTVPGEFITYPTQLGPREPVRVNSGNFGSAWILTLASSRLPCQKLLIDVNDDEFDRDVQIEAEDVPGASPPFKYVGGGKLSRRAGDPRQPLEITLQKQHVGRLKLIVTDYGNRPLDITAVRTVAAARQIVFERKNVSGDRAQLFYGNPLAVAPRFDLNQTLPVVLQPPPVRLQLGEQQNNPTYEPPPKALSERWPWAIYVVLGTASVVLAGVLFNLGRTAVNQHDTDVKQ